jgi:hypothetical protein
MRLPRVRFTVGGMMIAVAVIAALLWGAMMWRARSEYLRLAADRARNEAAHRSMHKIWADQAARLGPEHESWKWSKEQAAWETKVTRYHAKVRRLYEEAARHPWRSAPEIPYD